MLGNRIGFGQQAEQAGFFRRFQLVDDNAFSALMFNFALFLDIRLTDGVDMAGKLTGIRSKLRRTTDAVRGLLYENEDESDEPAPEKKRRIKRRSRNERPETNFDSVEEALSELQERDIPLVAGRVQIIKLGDLKAEMGAKWDKYAARIDQIIQSAIRQNLAREDLHWRAGELNHLIVFADLDEEEAEEKCLQIRNKIDDYLKGRPDLADKITIEAAVAAIDGPDDLLDFAEEELSSGDEGAATRPPATETSPEQSALEDEPRPAKWRTVVDDPEAARANIRELSWVQQPLWDTEQRIINAVAIVPVDPDAGVRRQQGSVLSAWSGGAMTLALDQQSLTQVSLIENNAPAAVDKMPAYFFQFHWGTLLADKLRRQFFESAGKLNNSSRVVRIAEIVGLGDKQYGARPFPGLGELRRSFDQVAVFCDLVAPQFSDLDGNVEWVGFSLYDTALSEDEAVDAISNFTSLAEKRGLKTYARDMPTQNLATAAISFGVRYIFEPSLSPWPPEQPGQFDISRLVRSAET